MKRNTNSKPIAAGLIAVGRHPSMSKPMSGANILVISLLVLLGASDAYGQTNAEVFSGIQLSFSAPGARSLGLGGAFVGLADDATAAFANPAGLTILRKAEVAFEGRSHRYKNVFTAGGHVFGAPTGIGHDTIDGLVIDTFENRQENISFLSFVYPKQSWRIAFYKHTPGDFETIVNNQGLFVGQSPVSWVWPYQASIDLEIVSVGISGAYKISDRLSVGLGISRDAFNLEAITRRFARNVAFIVPDFENEENVDTYQQQWGHDEDLSFNIGFLWQIPRKFSIGGVYRNGSTFHFSSRTTRGPASETPGEVSAEVGALFRIPDVYGVGFALAPKDSLRITFDYNRVKYSSLAEDTVDIYAAPSDDSQLARDIRAATRKLAIRDSNEYHLGVEFFFVKMKSPLSLRLGCWYDPDHRIRFVGEPGQDVSSRAFSVVFRPSDDVVHYSAGIGIAFGKNERIQIDTAVDTSEITKTFSLSSVYRFARR